jgi:glucokinase
MILCGDFGGTLTKLGLVEEGRIVAGTTIDSASMAGEDEWLRVLAESAAALCQSAGTGMAALSGMVWALPLIIDPGQRRATRGFGKFEAATQPGFCERAEHLFGLPLLLENDARAALIGEWHAGAGRGTNDLVLVTLGTGIGTAAIIDGKPLRGRSGMAGNLGGLSITHFGSDSPGGLPPGCTEGQVGSWTLARRAGGMAGFAASPLATEPCLDYRAVFQHAERGDPLARRLRDEALDAWGALSVNLIQAYDPQRLISGGGIMAAGDIILAAVRKFVDQHAIQAGGPVEIVAGTLKDHAALIGCECIWKQANLTST